MTSLNGFHAELRQWRAFGSPTAFEERVFGDYRVPVYANEFWSAKQRGGHRLHEISYRACYKPELPAFFIKRFCQLEDCVYDPFAGRGTTLIEARLRGCRVVGNDINPLSRVLALPRLNPPSLEAVGQRLESVDLSYCGAMDPDLLVFFDERTLAELYAWRAWFKQRRQEATFDKVDAWLEMVACNRLTGHSNGFFSVYTLPPNQATSVTAQRKINAKRNQTPEYRDTKALILRKSAQLLKEAIAAGYGDANARILTESADHTPAIADNSVRLVVTSPQFTDTVDYIADYWMRMWFCQLEMESSKLWQLRKVEVWSERMRGVLFELKRVLQPGGIIAFEVGEVRKGKVLLENEIVVAGIAAGLRPECILIQVQDFTKTANCWGVDNNSKGTNSNRIVVFSGYSG